MPELNALYRIDQFIDTFALGHYARVLEAVDLRSGQTVAFKLLRPEHLTLNGSGELRWEVRAFGNEALLLRRLADNPHVVDLLDCGFVSAVGEAPMGGEGVSMGQDTGAFAAALAEYAGRGWRPYLALQYLPRTHSLFYLMKPSKPGERWRLPSEEGLALALQFADLLAQAHAQGIVYLDHKLEHVYWDGKLLRIIDLNSSRLLDGGARGDAQQFRMDVHNLCVGILYPVFTGMSPQKTALRPQPGTLQDVDERYRDITDLDFGMEPSLSLALQNLLRNGAAQAFDTVAVFQAELRAVAALHGWDFSGQYTNPASRDARAHLRQGLALLREGQDKMRQARDLFREAAIEEGITEDLEEELRRLVRVANTMLNNRVIP